MTDKQSIGAGGSDRSEGSEIRTSLLPKTGVLTVAARSACVVAHPL